MTRQDIAVDFDNTCVVNDYPNIGEDVPHAIRVLKRFQSAGHRIILHSMRDKAKLRAAKEWFFDNGIQLYAAGKNPKQFSWTTSHKTHADWYIDDKTMVMRHVKIKGEKCVDWLWVERYAIKKHVI